MKLVEQSVELVKQEPGIEGFFKHIERCGRVCYKSEDRITEGSAEKFVELVLNNGHLSVLEHGEVSILGDKKEYLKSFKSNFTRMEDTDESVGDDDCAVSSNARWFVERISKDGLKPLKDLWPYLPKIKNPKNRRVTFHVTTSRATIDEFLRHRTLSASVESTRFCNYGKDKFDNEITFVMPTWAKDNAEASAFMKESFEEAEYAYLQLVKCWDNRKPDRRYRTGYKGNPLTPQQARQVLPLGIKSEAYLTAFVDDWIAVMEKRIIPAAHPDAVELATMIRDSLIKAGYCTYDDFITLKL